MILAQFAGAQALPDSANGETFSLSGTVVNSVTGAPIARALVRTMGSQQRSAFSDSDGNFQIDGMQAGRAMVMAQKPGYVTEQGASGSSPRWIEIGASTGAVVLKLVPQGAIFGRVVDASGQPIEHMPLRLTARSLREGRKVWEQRGMTESDEDGDFRFANLMPGTYYVATGPMVLENELLPAGERPKAGFPHVYYPGVPDLASASPIQLSAGQQMEADFSLGTVPVYQVSGRVAGHVPDQGVSFQVLSAPGDDISLPVHFSMETGTFQLEGVPAGSYIVRARSGSGGQSLRGEARLSVTSNVGDLSLALAPTISIPVQVRLEARNPSDGGSSAGGQQQFPVAVRLWPVDPNTAESFSSFDRSSGRPAMVFQNVDPGKYMAILTPQPPWYVQSASYGQTNLLTDDLSVANGQSYPMEIVLRNDSASLSGTIRASDAGQSPAMVVIVPQAGKMSPRVIRSTEGDFNASGLAPGDYLVFAFDQLGGLEYTNPDALEPYASEAAHVTLSANQTAQVSVDLIHVQKGD